MSLANSFRDAYVSNRYNDAYAIARFTVRLGSIVKVAGVLVGLVVMLLSFLAKDDYRGWTVLVSGLILAVVAGGLLFLLGVIVSAVGQILQATLDTAVNTSPFISDEQKIKIMDS